MENGEMCAFLQVLVTSSLTSRVKLGNLWNIKQKRTGRSPNIEVTQCEIPSKNGIAKKTTLQKLHGKNPATPFIASFWHLGRS